MKTFKFSLVLRTRENTDVFISLDDNIYGIHSKRINILYLFEKIAKDTLCRDFLRMFVGTFSLDAADISLVYKYTQQESI